MSTNLLTFKINSSKDEEFINISAMLQKAISQNNIASGIAIVFCPHTTAGITINENADPDVVYDMLYGFDKAYPKSRNYRHFEGNSHAHLKASTVGMSETLIIENHRLLLGTWQGVYFCEFDGPRTRTVYMKIIEG
jgi:secondary thiamine-phosphate synthase enzyme